MTRKKKPAHGADNVLFEIGNHAGDHAVAEVPRGDCRRMEDLLQRSGVRPHRELPSRTPSELAQRIIEGEDQGQLTYLRARVYEGDEDLEDGFDREADDADREADYMDDNGQWWIADSEPEVVE